MQVLCKILNFLVDTLTKKLKEPCEILIFYLTNFFQNVVILAYNQYFLTTNEICYIIFAY